MSLRVSRCWVGVVAALSLNPAGSSRAADPATVVVSSSLPTAQGQIRQFAFDGDPATYFQADRAGTGDHFTLAFDRPVSVKGLTLVLGRPDGGAVADLLDAGVVEVAAEPDRFGPLGQLAGETTKLDAGDKPIRALRIKPTKDQDHPWAIREIAIEAADVAPFRHPVEFTVDVSDAPELKDWAENVARLCERWYPRLVDELPSDNFRPTRRIRLTLSKDYDGVAEAGGGRIKGSVEYYKQHPDDLGSMIHETVHIIQNYRSRRNPGWLVEGLADYIRFFEYEKPGQIGPINADRAHYNDSYRTSARFLAFVKEKYAPNLIPELNRRMREGRYNDETFRELTGKDLKELDDEWRASLPRRERRKSANPTN